MSKTTNDNVLDKLPEEEEKEPVPKPKPPNSPPLYHRPGFWIALLVMAALAVGAGFYYLHARHFEDTDDAFIDGHVVPISPQISAKVLAVHIDDNTFVRQGDLLLELDPTNYNVALAQARGAQAAAQGKLEQARSGVPSARAAVAQAQAQLKTARVNLDTAERDLRRFQGLDARAKSQQQMEDAISAQERAEAGVEQAAASLEAAQANVTTAEANVGAAEGGLQQAQADTQKAEVDLGYCHILAPADGKVTNKNVEPGSYVTPASQLLQLVPADVWVTANFKETQLEHMSPGEGVDIHVDAYPDHVFHGSVQSIQQGTGSRFSIIPAENATGNFVKIVQRVPVKITFKNPVNDETSHPLVPGMSVEPKVRVQ